MKNLNVTPVESLLGYCFSDKSLLIQALTRKAYAQEQHQRGYVCQDQEVDRLLGDTVLKLVLVEFLEQKGYATRGEITQAKATLESRKALGNMELVKKLAPFIRLGNGELSQKIDQQISVRAETFEAIIAAIYKDGGLPAVQDRVKQWFCPLL